MEPQDKPNPPPKPPTAEELLISVLAELKKQTTFLQALRDGLTSK